MPCTRHRVFLATLIVAAKYLNDSSPKNKHWAIYASVFDTAEINLMERQLLFLLDFDLRFTEAEACEAFKPFMKGGNKDTRQSALSKVAKASKARVAALALAGLGGVKSDVPPTPPYDAVPPSLRLKNASESRSSPPGVSMKPTSSTDSDMSMGSLTEDSGMSSSSSEEEDAYTDALEDKIASSRNTKPFVLRPVPAAAYRRTSGTGATTHFGRVGLVPDSLRRQRGFFTPLAFAFHQHTRPRR